MSDSASIITLMLSLVAAFGLPIWMLRPAAWVRKGRPQRQFLLSDLMWLMVMMQMGLAAVIWWLERRYWPQFFVLAPLAVIAIWWVTLGLLSSAGVKSVAKRGVMLVLVVPVALAIMMVTVFAAFGAIACVQDLMRHRRPFHQDWRALVYIVFLLPMVISGRFLTRWAVGKPKESQSDTGER